MPCDWKWRIKQSYYVKFKYAYKLMQIINYTFTFNSFSVFFSCCMAVRNFFPQLCFATYLVILVIYDLRRTNLKEVRRHNWHTLWRTLSRHRLILLTLGITQRRMLYLSADKISINYQLQKKTIVKIISTPIREYQA